MEYFELTIGELPGRLRILGTAFEPRFAQKTLTTKEGKWFDDLELAQKQIARIDSVAAMYRTLHPEAKQLLALCEKLRESSTALPVEQGVPLANAADALRNFIEATLLKEHIGRLQGQLAHERGLLSLGAVDDSTGELEAKIKTARAVLSALQD